MEDERKKEAQARVAEAAELALGVLERIFADEKQFYRYPVNKLRNGEKVLGEKVLKKADTLSFKRAADALAVLNALLNRDEEGENTLLVTFEAGDEAFNE